jgi:hypothetical protein
MKEMPPKKEARLAACSFAVRRTLGTIQVVIAAAR